MITEHKHSEHFESSLHISDASAFKNHRSIISPNGRLYKHSVLFIIFIITVIKRSNTNLLIYSSQTNVNCLILALLFIQTEHLLRCSLQIF